MSAAEWCVARRLSLSCVDQLASCVGQVGVESVEKYREWA